MTHTVFIDIDSHVATASATGTAAPDVPLKHLTKQTLAFAFHSSGTVAAVTGWSTGRVVIKATPTSDVLLLDTTLAATGSTTSTRYSAEWAAVDCDSSALRTLIGASVEPLDVFAEIQWTADSGTHAVAFPIQIVPTFNLPEDAPPDPTSDAAWDWIKARLAAGSNITFTDNDTTQVRTIAASGGGGGGGGSVDWGDIGGTLSNQTDLQTALNNKQPLASALTTLSSATAAGLALMDDADNAAQRTTLGLGTIATQAASSVNITGGTLQGVTLNGPTISGGVISGSDLGSIGAITALSITLSQGVTAQNATFAGTIEANGYIGSGALLSSLNASFISSGTLSVARIADGSITNAKLATTPGNALTTNPLSQFAATTSDQLRGVISDETGSGALVFANSPTLVTPALGTPSSGVLTNCTGLPIAGLASFVGLPVSIQLACSDEGTALTTGTAKLTFRMPHAMTLTAVRASVGTAPTGSTLVVDINEGGASILGTKLSIDATEKTSTTAASAATITDAALADDAEITIDIDQIGSTIAGAGLKVTLIGTRA